MDRGRNHFRTAGEKITKNIFYVNWTTVDKNLESKKKLEGECN